MSNRTVKYPKTPCPICGKQIRRVIQHIEHVHKKAEVSPAVKSAETIG